MKDNKSTHKPELTRSLTLFSLIMMGVGMMIGSGVFVATGNSIAIGGAGAVTIAFAINGLIALFTAMSYAELASAIPRAGGPYNWANYGLGSVFGFLAGWMEWLAASVAGSLYAKTFAVYLVKFLNEELFINMLNLNFTKFQLNFFEIFLTVFVAILFIYINYRGASETGLAAIVFALGQMITLLIIIVFGVIIAIKNPERIQNFTPFLPNGWGKILFAMGLTYVAFEGFEVICQAGDEAIDPKRNIPKALFYSVIFVVITYILISFTVALGANNNGNPVDSLADWFSRRGATTAFTDAVKGIISFGGWLVPIAVVFSATSALNATIYSGTRISYALGRDKFLPHVFSKISAKTRIPVIALLATAVIVILIAVFIPIEHVLAAASILFLFVFLIGNISVIKIRKDHSHKLKYGYVMPLFPFITIIAIVVQIFMIGKLFQESLWTWPIVFGWIFIGILVYLIYSHSHHVKIEMPVVELELKRYVHVKDYNILLAISNPKTVQEITDLGNKIAEDKDGDITIFNFIPIPEQSPLSIVNNYLVDSNKIVNESKEFINKKIPVLTSIKYGRDTYRGISKTVQENKSKILIMGWMGKKSESYYSLSHTLDHIIENIMCNLIVVKPCQVKKTKKVKKIFMATYGGTHAMLALEIASIIAKQNNAVIDVYSYETLRAQNIVKNYDKIKTCLENIVREKEVKYSFVLKNSNNVVKSVLNDSKDYDLIVLGASEKAMFKKKVFGTIPETIANITDKELLMVKSSKGIKSFISRWFGA